MKRLFPVLSVFWCLLATHSFAGSATWKLDPVDGDWSNPANWEEGTVPNGPGDTATLANSNLTKVTIQSNVEVGQIVFAAAASAFTITIAAEDTLTLSGVGVTNNSSEGQNFVVEIGVRGSSGTNGTITLENNATSGSNTVFTCKGAVVGNFTAGGSITFYGSSSAAESTFILEGGAVATASGGGVLFYDNSTAANATFVAEGGTVANAFGAGILVGEIGGTSSAGNATMILNGGIAPDAAGAGVSFFDVAASEPTLIANGGVNGGRGGQVQFWGHIPGNLAHVELYGDALLDISQSFNTTIGSLTGDGMIDLGDFMLTLGGTNENTFFTGIIHEVHTEGYGGSLKKIGTGTLRLSHDNAFRGVTKVVEGTLVIENQTGSGTGTSEVVVKGGTLAGNGIIAEEVTVTPGSFLAPGAAAKETRTLTLQKTLTFRPTSTYTYKLNASRASADQVIANGVTIGDRVRFDFKAVEDEILTSGTVFTVISNTSANPINGTFLHLPDNSTIAAGSNIYQASYSGGDGNDLTLTVVP